MVNKKLIIGGIIGVLVIASLVYISILFIAPKPSAPELWLENPTLDSPVEPTWFWRNGTEGDNSDVAASTTPGLVNLAVLGDEQTTEISAPLNDGTWDRYRNENFLFPDYANITTAGCYVTHDYNEAINQTHQYHSVHWRKNVDTGKDMADYRITEASLNVIFNASVSENLEVLNEVSQYTVGDFVRFYVLLADTGYENPIRVAYNRTISLGLDIAHRTISDAILETVGEQDLITALESALEKDPNHSNFSITIGIDVYCEDNRGTDRDTFNALIIKSLNLTFSYVKIINQFTTLSWNQYSEQIISDNYQIIGGNFNFKYMIDKIWTTSAPLSEIRFYINEKLYSEETIKLSTINTTFKEAKSGGFDVLSFLEKNVNISITIEISIKDYFQLDEQYTISIDDVYLYIEIREIVGDFSFLIYILIGSIAGLSITFTLYEKHFKYPPMVRKVRKLKRKIRKNKKILKLIDTRDRSTLLGAIYQNKLKFAEIEPSIPSSTQIIESAENENELEENSLK
ncbi:MAG: hypothetical protein ACFE9N_10740 [Promethearchaeota archaeon]